MAEWGVGGQGAEDVARAGSTEKMIATHIERQVYASFASYSPPVAALAHASAPTARVEGHPGHGLNGSLPPPGDEHNPRRRRADVEPRHIIVERTLTTRNLSGCSARLEQFERRWTRAAEAHRQMIVKVSEVHCQ